MRRVMPAEWFPQSAVQLTWPHENTDWAYMLQDVTACYVRMAFEIATREKLIIVAPDVEAVKTLLEERLPRRATENITYVACPTNDTWARDHAFITVIGEKIPNCSTIVSMVGAASLKRRSTTPSTATSLRKELLAENIKTALTLNLKAAALKATGRDCS